MALYSRSPIQNFNNWWFWIREKTNTLLNLINEQRDIDKIYLYTKDLGESKYEHLIKNRESLGIKHLNDLKAFIEYSNTMNDVYENIDLYNPNRRRKVLFLMI